MTWETTETEDRRGTGDSPVYKVYPDHLVQQESREHQESSDQVDKEDPLDQLDHQEKKGTSASLDQWDLLEHVELAAKSDLRDLLESQAPLVSLALPAPPQLPWMTCLATCKTTMAAPLPLPSSMRMRLCPTAMPPSSWTQVSRPL